MINLFRGNKIETLFSKIEREFMNEIDEITENRIISIDLENFTKQLTEKYKIRVPILDKGKTSSVIVKEQVLGEQLPPGTSFVPGRPIEIEVVDYKVPFSGDASLFGYQPKKNTGWSTQGDISYGSVFFRLTNWGTISGKNDEIEKLKELARDYILKIEEELNNLSGESKIFNEGLGDKIKSHIEKRVKEIKTKLESNDKLKPF